ncbi:MAG: type II secretion system F family protein [Candidatus Doudnabacteria bacterium]|nr:type II secretion system F family protein [Candidatus Doudnabacteria bacterium]
MPEFSYIARSKTGSLEQDVMTAVSERAVADALRAKGLMPTSIKALRKSFDLEILKGFLTPIRLIEKITFIKNLSVMLKAGLPAAKSLKILSTQTTNQKFVKVISDLAKAVEAGTSLADAMGKHPGVFSPIFVSMVRAGEISGNLEKNLLYLSEQMQRDYDLISKARGALTYPIVVLIALGIVGFLMFTFVLPKLTDTFKDLNVPLPLMTRVVMAVVDLFAKYGIFIIFLLILCFFGFMYWRKSEGGKKVIHMAVFYVPIGSGIVKKINLARFVRTFSSLMKSGMPIVEALEVSSHVVGNIYYQKVIAEAAAKVKVGSPLAASFKKQPKLFPNLVVEMMEVGEESGTTDEVLSEVAAFYESEVDQTMKNLSSILEPVIMMVIGAVVGLLAVALVTPIYNITQSIG